MIRSFLQVPAVILPFLYTTPLTDALFCTLAVLHSHWGVEAIVVDYIRPSLFGGSTFIPNLCVGWVEIKVFQLMVVSYNWSYSSLVWILSAVTLGALYYFNYTDVGIVNAIKMLWKLWRNYLVFHVLWCVIYSTQNSFSRIILRRYIIIFMTTCRALWNGHSTEK